MITISKNKVSKTNYTIFVPKWS